ncbi:MAG: hypothetical protein C0620_05525 [Desulfuromonas sp.]|nr:MAG: hypothetical protein C0620_05525 [Desulfuromonas sp.]
MRTFLVILAVLAGVIPAAAASIDGRVVEVDRQQGILTLEVAAAQDAAEQLKVQMETIPADIQLGEMLTVETAGNHVNGMVAGSGLHRQQGWGGHQGDQTGVRSRLRKVQNGGGSSSGQGARRGRH